MSLNAILGGRLEVSDSRRFPWADFFNVFFKLHWRVFGRIVWYCGNALSANTVSLRGSKKPNWFGLKMCESFKHCGRWLMKVQRERSAEMPGCGGKDSASFPPPPADPIAPSVLTTSHNYVKIRCQQCSVVLSDLNYICLFTCPVSVNLKEVLKWVSSPHSVIAVEINVDANKDSPR